MAVAGRSAHADATDRSHPARERTTGWDDRHRAGYQTAREHRRPRFVAQQRYGSSCLSYVRIDAPLFRRLCFDDDPIASSASGAEIADRCSFITQTMRLAQ